MQKGDQAIALYDYEATEGDGLDLEEGDELTILDVDGEWSEGTNTNGESGWFPTNYVEKVKAKAKKKALPALPLPSKIVNDTSGGTITVRALYDFDATDEEEMTIREGDLITLIDQDDDDWWTGTCSGKTGCFPRTYVEIVDEGADTAAARRKEEERERQRELEREENERKQREKERAEREKREREERERQRRAREEAEAARKKEAKRKAALKKKAGRNPKPPSRAQKPKPGAKPNRNALLAAIQGGNKKKMKKKRSASSDDDDDDEKQSGASMFERSREKVKREKKDRLRRRKAVESVRMVADVFGVDDMVMLPKLNEKSVVRNLTQRHKNDVIYTYIGNVLISVNPFKWITMYDDHHINRYRGKQLVDAPPHIFAIAESAYREMIEEEESQCCIISGESGAGKTEAAKQIMRYIAAVSGGGNCKAVSRVKDVIMQSNPVLEAFGNAMTLRNNNSSRFGKYLEIQFDLQGRPRGGKVTTYLLEKSRVVRPGKGERSFHIFYMLLKACPSNLRDELQLGQPSEFQYLRRSGTYVIDNDGGRFNDKTEFHDMTRAMEAIGINKSDRAKIFRLLAGILHLGNVSFAPARVGSADGSSLRDRRALEIAAELLGVDDEGLEFALTFVVIESGGETFESPLNPTKATAARDALAKSIYSKIFNYIVRKINIALRFDDAAAMDDGVYDEADDEEDLLTIGVLDIYGFEVFEKNVFEQFCINYVNEKLQQIFIELTLKAEQEEYAREGIEWEEIPFFNNKTVCQLIEARRPPGIMTILNDTCKTMHAESTGVDGKFLDKLRSFQSKHKHFTARGQNFVVKHYAGDVEYTVQGFCTANKDSLADDLWQLVAGSDNDFLNEWFGNGPGNGKKKTSTEKIKGQCKALVDKLMSCSPHYVRCLKSNDQKKKDFINASRMMHQCKYLGILENIKVRRAGFAYRAEFHRFADRFRLLSRKTWPGPYRGSDRDACSAIIKQQSRLIPELGGVEVQLGKRKIFIKQPQTFFKLERQLQIKRNEYACKIQAAWRKYLARRDLVEMRLEMARLYTENNKKRSRGSVYRPFDGNYLHALPEAVREAALAIIEYHDDEEYVVFGDVVKKLEPGTGDKNDEDCDGEVVSRIFIITNKAMYTMEHMIRSHQMLDPSEIREGKERIAKKKKKRSFFSKMFGSSKRTIEEMEEDEEGISATKFKHVHLRRRTLLRNVTGIQLSHESDDLFMVTVKPDEVLPLPDKSHWVPDDDCHACMQTGKPFGKIFNRRHHCRLTGNQYCDSVCNAIVLLPDLGWYTPQRIHDGAIGFASTEMREDLLLLSQRKTEICGVLHERAGGRKALDRFITFTNNMTAAQAPLPELSRTPAGNVRVQRMRGHGNLTVANAFPEGEWEIDAPSGVPRSVVEARLRRDERRAQERLAQREEERAIRAAKNKERQAERAAARAERIAAKRARKAAAREKKKGARARKVAQSAQRSAGGHRNLQQKKKAEPSWMKKARERSSPNKEEEEVQAKAKTNIVKAKPPPLMKKQYPSNGSAAPKMFNANQVKLKKVGGKAGKKKSRPLPKGPEKAKAMPAWMVKRQKQLAAAEKSKNGKAKSPVRSKKKNTGEAKRLPPKPVISGNKFRSASPKKSSGRKETVPFRPLPVPGTQKNKPMNLAAKKRLSKDLLKKAFAPQSAKNEKKDEIDRLETALAAAVASRDYHRAAELGDKIEALKAEAVGQSMLDHNAEKIAELEEELENALASRDYHRAADIEDDLKALRKEGGGGGGKKKKVATKMKRNPTKPKRNSKPKIVTRPKSPPRSAWARKQARLAAEMEARDGSGTDSSWESD
eukprot:g1713.t1